MAGKVFSTVIDLICGSTIVDIAQLRNRRPCFHVSMLVCAFPHDVVQILNVALGATVERPLSF